MLISPVLFCLLYLSCNNFKNLVGISWYYNNLNLTNYFRINYIIIYFHISENIIHLFSACAQFISIFILFFVIGTRLYTRMRTSIQIYYVWKEKHFMGHETLNKNAYVEWKLQGVCIAHLLYIFLLTNTFAISLYIHKYAVTRPYILNIVRHRMAFATRTVYFI